RTEQPWCSCRACVREHARAPGGTQYPVWRGGRGAVKLVSGGSGRAKTPCAHTVAPTGRYSLRSPLRRRSRGERRGFAAPSSGKNQTHTVAEPYREYAQTPAEVSGERGLWDTTWHRN